MADSSALDAAIAALNAQRAALGDIAVDAAIEALRRHAPVQPPAAETRQRLRQVSVLFVDVADSTHLLSQVGPQDADELLGQALQRFVAIVQACGGQVLRFTGDGLKAAFGSVGTREDEAVHAVHAGLQILQAAAEHAQRVAQQLQVAGFGVRAGIHTGPVLLGGGAEAERGALGHAVHLAARMEQSAPVGCLRISHDTWSLVRGLFRVQTQPPLWVKGHDEPLLTYLVLGAASNPERAAQRGIEGLATPMIGRDAEMQHLLSSFERACSQRSLRAATVLAEAGVGKTRLRRELLARLSSGTDGMRLLEARAHPDSGLQPYGLLRQLVARWLSIADDLDSESVRARLVGGLAPWLGRRGHERAQLIGQLIGVDFSASVAVQSLGPRELRAQAFAALTDLLHALAAHAPLVVVLDDLHWADDASLDFVQHFLRAAPVPLLLLMLARPALIERRPTALANEDVGHETLHLRLLDVEQGPALLDALLQHLPQPPEALGRLLVERAAGNPFYMEELVRMLIDDGVIDARRLPWSIRADWQDKVRVPTTLAGVLQARLHALPADELTAMQQASIVGPVFWDSALAAIDQVAPAALPALQARALVTARPSSAFADTAEHAFHHQLLHDVTYDTVLRAARREGHARVARWLADRVADRASEFLGITAAHFERAGDSAQALDYYDRARENASDRFAHAAVLAYIEGALRQPALTAPMWHYHLLMEKQVRLENLGRLDESAGVMDEMAAFAEARNSDALRADVMCTRMLWADREGRVAEAEALAHKAIALAEPEQASGPAALAHGEVAVLALQRREFESALEHTTKGLRWARECAKLHWRDGGLVGYQYQLPIIGVEALLQQQRWPEARAAVTETLATLPLRRRREQLSLLLQRARAESYEGDLDAARRTCDELAAVAVAVDIARTHADVANALAEVAALQGDVVTLERAATEAETRAREASYSMALAMAWKNRGAAAAERGETAAARALWADAQRQYEEQGMPPEALGVRAELAELDRREGRIEAAAGAALSVLAEGRGGDDSAGAKRRANPWPLLEPPTLLRCHAILVAAGDTHAAPVLHELQRRLQQELAQLPDAATRERLVRALPYWRETARLGVAR
jgi:class 3 adenylate cyclase